MNTNQSLSTEKGKRDAEGSISVPTLPKEDHLQQTANIRRESTVVNMKVSKIQNASSTVKYLVLNTSERPVPISFKAGQWVDMFISEVETVGGFSICSSPMHLNRTGDLHLSVKKSDHPPSEWVHTKCIVGSEVSIRIGGDFFLDTNDHSSAGKNILLVAGGVGINPIASIIFQLQEYRKHVGIFSPKTMLMFSAKSEEELIFSNLFNAIEVEDPTFSVQYFVTGTDNDVSGGRSVQQQNNKRLKYGRITKLDVVRNITQSAEFENVKESIIVYICGPPPMIQEVEEIVTSLGIRNILYEKWW